MYVLVDLDVNKHNRRTELVVQYKTVGVQSVRQAKAVYTSPHQKAPADSISLFSKPPKNPNSLCRFIFVWILNCIVVPDQSNILHTIKVGHHQLTHIARCVFLVYNIQETSSSAHNKKSKTLYSAHQI